MTSRRKQSDRRKTLDSWFPTVVRWGGLGLLVYAVVADRGRTPALLPTAAGMILFKTVYGEGPPDKE